MIDFLKNSSNYQAHITFLVNPFSSETVLLKPKEAAQSFSLNGTIIHTVVEATPKDNEFVWSRYISDNPLKMNYNFDANLIVDLFGLFQTCIAESLSANRSSSIPAMQLSLGKNDQALLSIVHDISDWVITFDKHIGPEFYDLPCTNENDIPYLLDYIPNDETTGISSYLTTRPTSENDDKQLKTYLKPGRLMIVDLRDELIAKEEALGLFVVMLNIFSNVKEINGETFNKFIVFDEAHKYMNNSDLTDSIVTAIREMRHKGVSLMIASQDPMSLPNAIIELSSIVLLHRFNSPQWVKHIQKSITQLSTLSATEMAILSPGEAYLWATKATDKQVMNRPIKISTRPRITKHGGDTIKAI